MTAVRTRIMTATLVALAATFAAPLAAQTTWQSQSLDLGYAVSTVRADAQRNRLYVSAPLSNRVFEIDPVSMTVLRKLYVGFHPDGIELASDGHTLYAALNGAGAVGVYDLDTDQQSELDISVLLGTSYAKVVTEARPGLLFVAAQNFVRIDLATLAATQIYSPYDITQFGKDPAGNVLYVGSASNAVFKFDITQASAPMVYQSPQYLYGVDRGIDVSADGNRLVLGSGEVIRANELTENGTVGYGAAMFSADDTQIISATGAYPIVLKRFDGTTLDLIESIPTQCSFSAPGSGIPSLTPKAMQALPYNQGWVILGDTTVCVVRLPDELFANGFE